QREPLIQGASMLGVDAARGNLLLPPRTEPACRRQQVCRGFASLGSGTQSFEFGADRFARRNRLGACRVVTLCVPGEELVARRTEALPDGFRPRLLDRTDRLPLGLQLPNFAGGPIPVGTVRQRFGLFAQRFFLRE